MTTTPATAEAMEAAYCDPSTGSIKRRWLRRRLANVIAVGPSALPAPPRAPIKADLVAAQKHADEVERRHRETVAAELAAVDAHAANVARRVESLGDADRSFTSQELRAEARQLRELRTMVEADLASGPIRTDRDGRPLDDRDRAIVRMRAAELRELKWTAAARAAAEGDHRRARILRRDSLRARQIAEAEIGWRQSLPGYGLAMWN